ncbi:MAG: polyprenyl diphosphate synthase [Gemmatimonadaceae bacterium]
MAHTKLRGSANYDLRDAREGVGGVGVGVGAALGARVVAPRHIAIIMDGNGRWAVRRGKVRAAGHLAGGKAVRRTVEESRRLGVEYLTLYAFSSDNWRRPPEEVAALMKLFRRYLAAEVSRCVENGVRLHFVGRRDRLTPELQRAMVAAERATCGETGLHLRVAIDYSAKDVLVRAATQLDPRRPATRETFAAALAAAMHDTIGAPEVDLLIRTGGERRLSDFLLWESAYAELVFLDVMWPDFGEAELRNAIETFHARDRRYGGLTKAAGAAS